MINEPLKTIEQTAAFLNVSVDTVYWYRRHNRIDAYKVGKELRFSMEQIEEFLKTTSQRRRRKRFQQRERRRKNKRPVDNQSVTGLQNKTI